MKRRAAVCSLALLILMLFACAKASKDSATYVAGFGEDVSYLEPTTTIDPSLAAPFSIDEVKNLEEMAKAYGIVLTAPEMQLLADRKFVLKRVPETAITPHSTGQQEREFLGLYSAVSGGDAVSRTQANTLFWTADIFLHSYTLLEAELLKEMENTVFAPAMTALSKEFYHAAATHLASAGTNADRLKWTKVRNYFAVPYALLSTAIPTLTKDNYTDANGVMRDPAVVSAEFTGKDKAADTEGNAKAFVERLALDAESRTAVLADLHKIFAADRPAYPAVFEPEFKDYAAARKIRVEVDFSQLTPRGNYTSSSLRRQYFRAMRWYVEIPFFVQSDPLTGYAFAISQLMAENPEQLKSYSLLESTIHFMVGASDSLMPADYLTALEATKDEANREAAIRSRLLTARKPRFNSESVEAAAVRAGMRFFSGKFLLDSHWTGYLTQGDEKPRPGYAETLPLMASSLEVMALLGSAYAKRKIPELDFYAPTAEAIDQALKELTAETQAMKQSEWQENAHIAALWTIRGMFDFEQRHRAQLPPFMQADWEAKTLQSATGFWTELRHTGILYANGSYAEGGGPLWGEVAKPAKGYIEPQPIAYRRLKYLAERTGHGLKSRGFSLHNLDSLEAYISTMEKVVAYTDKELANAVFSESVEREVISDKAVLSNITQSDWEFLRKGLVDGLTAALPMPVEGPELSVRDKRAAVAVDIHTTGKPILYEGTGVPYVILVAVKDANGPRLSIGFTYSQFEFRESYGSRLTDEQWQERFYKGADAGNPFDYTAPSVWPALNSWYAPLFQTK